MTTARHTSPRVPFSPREASRRDPFVAPYFIHLSKHLRELTRHSLSTNLVFGQRNELQNAGKALNLWESPCQFGDSGYSHWQSSDQANRLAGLKHKGFDVADCAPHRRAHAAARDRVSIGKRASDFAPPPRTLSGRPTSGVRPQPERRIAHAAVRRVRPALDE
jgi:hypothetical protein